MAERPNTPPTRDLSDPVVTRRGVAPTAPADAPAAAPTADVVTARERASGLATGEGSQIPSPGPPPRRVETPPTKTEPAAPGPDAGGGGSAGAGAGSDDGDASGGGDAGGDDPGPAGSAARTARPAVRDVRDVADDVDADVVAPRRGHQAAFLPEVDDEVLVAQGTVEAVVLDDGGDVEAQSWASDLVSAIGTAVVKELDSRAGDDGVIGTVVDSIADVAFGEDGNDDNGRGPDGGDSSDTGDSGDSSSGDGGEGGGDASGQSFVVGGAVGGIGRLGSTNWNDGGITAEDDWEAVVRTAPDGDVADALDLDLDPMDL